MDFNKGISYKQLKDLLIDNLKNSIFNIEKYEKKKKKY